MVGVPLSSRVARAQQTVPIIGVLSVGPTGGLKEFLAPALTRLAEMGFADGRNLTIEYRGADHQQERLVALATEFAERRVAAIVTLGGPPTVAAKAATQSIPIVFRTGFDPVASGFVASLSRPAGNVTGIYILNPRLILKRLEVLHELAPAAKTIAFFYTDTGDANEKFYKDALERAAEPLGVRMILLNTGRVDEIEKLFAKAESEGAGAVLVNDHPVFATDNGKLIAGLAARYKMPAMYPARNYVSVGGLASYGSDSSEANRQLGDLVGRVLGGQKPEDLPVQQVTKVELVVNAKTAKSLDLAIPLPLLGLAEVID